MSKGERIKRCREALGLSQVEVAEALGVSKQLFYKYENDIITNIPSDKIESMAHILNVTPEYLMGWTELTAKSEKTVTVLWDFAKDKELMNALKVYGKMPPEKKKRVVDIIRLIGAE